MKRYDAKLSRRLDYVTEKLERAKPNSLAWVYWRWIKHRLEKKIPKER